MTTCRTAATGMTLLLLAATAATHAENAAVPARHGESQLMLDIPPLGLVDALNELGRQSGFAVVLDPSLAENHFSSRLVGQFTPEAALQQLLANTGLRFKFLDAHTIAILPTESADPGSVSESRGETARMRVVSAGQHEAQSAEKGAESSSTTMTQSTELTDYKGVPEILVKGSRIRNMDIVRTEDDAQPYYILDRQAIEKSGATNVEDFLKQRLTMNTNPVSSGLQPSNSTGNVSRINLRGVGTRATLILVDGRRTAGVPLSGSASQADINSIPLSMIERIEVLPSSAAAIYGGAAVGGVVNVVLKHSNEGGEFKATYDNTTSADAAIQTYDAAYGLTLEEGRTHVLIGGSYRDSGNLQSKDRPQFMARGFATAFRNDPSLIDSLAFPYTSVVGATPNIRSVTGENLTLRPEYGGASLNSSRTYIPAGTPPGVGATELGAALLANAGQQNLQLANTADYSGLLKSVMPAIRQHSFMVSLRREMTPGLSMFADYFTGTNQAQSIGSAYSINDATWTIPAGAPSNPFEQAVRISAPKPLITLYDAESKTQRVTAGLIQRLPKEWTAEADYTWNRSSAAYRSDLTSRTVRTDATNGVINPFYDTGTYPLALESYLGVFGQDAPASDLNDVALRAAGPLWRLPAGAPYLTVGIEHRKESLKSMHFVNDYPNYPETNQNIVYLPQSQTTRSLYAEAKVPLISPANRVTAVNLLDLQLATRYERYEVTSTTSQLNLLNPAAPPPVRSNTSYTSTNATIGLRYKPIETLLLRSSYGTAFLPPDYSQLLPAILQPNPTAGVYDPRRGNAQVVARFVAGGNPNLTPQDSRSWNVGVVWEPTGLEGWRAGLEWFHIEQLDVIITPGSGSSSLQQIVNNELTAPALVERGAVAPGDPYGVGPIQTIYAIPINAAKSVTKGFDLNLAYHLDAGSWGSFDWSVMGTLIQSYKVQFALGAAPQELVNQVSNGGPLKRKANATLSWNRGAWGGGWSASYFSSYPQIPLRILAQGSDHIPSQTYHNVFGEYRFPAMSGGAAGLLSDVTLQAGIRNVFNSTPPYDANFVPFYYSPFGDPRLRSYWLSLGKRF